PTRTSGDEQGNAPEPGGLRPEGLREAARARYLVIGYGNRLRGDDGVGPVVAENVSDLGLPGVSAIACDLLTPELADPISRAENVIFVDAALTAPRKVELRPIEVADSSQIMAHAADPRTLLALARDVFGHAPQAWLLTIPVETLGIGETFSPLAHQGLKAAVRMLRKMVAPGELTNDAAQRAARTQPRADAAGRCPGKKRRERTAP
ncbi:MAG: hydrogenase maturation protease, partial [Limisphaerales bacterium]